MGVARSIPARIRYRKGDAVLISYQQYLALKSKQKKPYKLTPLLKGKIVKPLDQESEDLLLDYMGIH